MNEPIPKIALAHEFLTQLGGAEKVLEELLHIYPGAPIHTLVYNPQKVGRVFGRYNIKTSFLQKIPGAQRFHRWFLAFMPTATESFNFKGYDIVIADASAFAKGVKVPEKTMLVCYCHTPTRYLWLSSREYIESLHYPSFVKSIIPPLLSWLRKWDYKAAQRPHYYIANSQTVKERISKFYGRESQVVFPPVNTEFFRPLGQKQDYFFAASRLEPYKKIELVIEAFNELGLPLKIAGSGTASERLKKIAKPNIEFLGRVSDEELRRRFSEARAYIFPAEEDAGIMPVEAMACGTPVIAYGAGGVLETVVDGKTGALFKEQSAFAIKQAIQEFQSEKFDPSVIRNHSLQFDRAVFRQKIKTLIEQWHADWNRHKSA